ncbi:MAG: membrane protein insertase YidC [Pseudomonadota bacterium]
MPNSRLFLLIALMACAFLIYQQWQIDYAPAAPAPAPVQELVDNVPPADAIPEAAQDSSDPPADIPTPGVAQTPAAQPEAAIYSESGDLITVQTDVLDLKISTRGGAIVEATLRDYPVKLKTPDTKVQLLSSDPATLFLAQSGIVSNTHPSADHTQTFTVEQSRFVLGDGAEELVVPMTWSAGGTTLTKTYRFARGSYVVGLEQALRNNSDQEWIGSDYQQLVRRPPPEVSGSAFSNPERYSFIGTGLYTAEGKYEKFDFEDLDDKAIARSGAAAWAAMVQHYFVTAWVPPAEQQAQLEAVAVDRGQRYRIRTLSPSQRVAPGAMGYFPSTLFVGPKLHDQIEPLAEGLILTVDYGIFTPFSKILFWLLDKIHTLTGNWGWAIVLLTVLVKAVFYKLSEAQYRSTAKLRKLQPRIQQLKERHGDDKQKFNVAMMEIYKKEKVNPLGGCLPILVQIPVFFALYWVLLESVELRQADFMLWINDLSSPDPLFILPVINGAAMFLTTKLSPNPAADPIQQRIFLAMPIVFSVMFAFFQAGLVLYWTVNAVLSLAQQWVITKRVEASG